ncbi:MAG: RnfABCDGE type electron transport complex subunit B [Planctomycetota bacterium]|nr:RnfABCDGE type electron transport complex subunit B [Planctomycetota bacterium]
MDWTAVGTAVSTLGGVAMVFGALIALAHHYFHVYEDPRLEAVTELLPGSNCGACGFAGCRAFAEGLVEGATEPACCTQLGADGIADVADYLGVAAGEAIKRVARLLCAGGHHTALQRAEYRGLETCAAAATIASGGKACTWGCLGLGDCEVVCDYDAITMNPFGLPVVDTVRCTACNDCVEACPKDLFVLMPVTQHLLVQCRSRIEGDEAEALCKVACTACGKCALDAAPGVIAMSDGLAVIDYTRNDQAGPEATVRCPTSAIVWVEDMQFADEGMAR